jgi:hypothetical protein
VQRRYDVFLSFATPDVSRRRAPYVTNCRPENSTFGWSTPRLDSASPL